jgi:hypothetical protein
LIRHKNYATYGMELGASARGRTSRAWGQGINERMNKRTKKSEIVNLAFIYYTQTAGLQDRRTERSDRPSDLLPAESGPGVPQADRAIKNKSTRFAVVIDTEVSDPLELELVKVLCFCKRRFYLAAGQDSQ